MNNQMIKCTEWSHPDWYMSLILPDDGSRGDPKDYLCKQHDLKLLKVKKCHEMTEEELDSLPEFDG